MTEPTKEQVWKEESRKAYQDQQSQDSEGGCREPIGFVQGYLAAKKSDFEELQKTRERLENACSKLKYATNSLEFANSLMDEDEDDVQEMNEWISEARVFIEQCPKTKKTRMKNE